MLRAMPALWVGLTVAEAPDLVCGEQKRTAHITNIKIRDMGCKSSI